MFFGPFDGDMQATEADITISPSLTMTYECEQIPYPFNAWEINDPVVSSTNPTSVAVGDEFVILGEFFYPSLVSAVLIDGDPLDPADFGDSSSDSDTQITVTVPTTVRKGMQPVEVETDDGTQTRSSNDDVMIDITD